MLVYPMHTERLILRPFRDEDIPAIHGIYSDPDVMRYVAYGKPLQALAETVQMVRDYNASLERHGLGFLAVIELDSGCVIGDVGFSVNEQADEEAEIEFGYTLGRKYWGRGFATEAGQSLLTTLFADTTTARVVSVTDPQNLGSINVLQKLGFQKTSVREAYGRPHLAFVRARPGQDSNLRPAD